MEIHKPEGGVWRKQLQESETKEKQMLPWDCIRDLVTRWLIGTGKTEER